MFSRVINAFLEKQYDWKAKYTSAFMRQRNIEKSSPTGLLMSYIPERDRY